jgi:hypothetical protein
LGGEGFTFKFVSQWWKGSFLYFFVDGASFIVGRMVAVAKDALDACSDFSLHGQCLVL